MIASESGASNGGSAAYVYFVSLVAATSGLLFGFDIAVINGAIVFLRQEWGLNELQTEIAASSLLIGCILGAAIGGWMSDKFGRKISLKICAVLFTISAIGAALPRNMDEFLVARFLGGIGIGAASMLAPIYIAEVAPARIRGRLVALNQMTIVTGMLMSYFANWVLSFQGANSWRWMFAVAAVPSVFFLISLFFVPESPRWLTERNREPEAMKVLTRINGEEEARRELGRIREAVAEETGTISELLQPGYRKALLVAVLLAVLQQWTGVNTVLFYGSVMLKDQLGSSSESGAIFSSVLIGTINFLATWVAIVYIDRWGRRKLLMGSAGTMMFLLVGMAWLFRQPNPPMAGVIALMLAFTGSFAVGMGPGVWVVMAEIFPNRIRGRAMGIATLALWLACTILTGTYLTISRALGPSGAFLIYSGMCLITVLVVRFMTPETKGHTLEEIEKIWKKGIHA
jgi:SP family arabinose:H+ symporter-like MFS transporter